jgi:hypothetical protein
MSPGKNSMSPARNGMSPGHGMSQSMPNSMPFHRRAVSAPTIDGNTLFAGGSMAGLQLPKASQFFPTSVPSMAMPGERLQV